MSLPEENGQIAQKNALRHGKAFRLRCPSWASFPVKKGRKHPLRRTDGHTGKSCGIVSPHGEKQGENIPRPAENMFSCTVPAIPSAAALPPRPPADAQVAYAVKLFPPSVQALRRSLLRTPTVPGSMFLPGLLRRRREEFPFRRANLSVPGIRFAHSPHLHDGSSCPPEQDAGRHILLPHLRQRAVPRKTIPFFCPALCPGQPSPPLSPQGDMPHTKAVPSQPPRVTRSRTQRAYADVRSGFA